MKDRVSLYPGRVKLTPVSGQENTYDMVRADEPTQEGTPLSKETFLKDDTAALFGLDATAVPDDALALIKQIIDSNYSELSSLANSKAKIATGSYVGTGKHGKSNPNSLTFDFVPKLVIVSGQGNSSNTGAGFIYCWGSKKYTLIYGGYGGAQTTCVVSLADKTMNWYDTYSVYYQCNDSGYVFNYIAIG